MELKRAAVTLVSIAAITFSASCFDSEATLCSTGITCPIGTQCAKSQAVCITDTCGNGNTDDGEACDDGNKLSGDGCSADCNFEGCGNGIVDIALSETCDDGNNLDGDGCSADCKTNERCGNGTVDSELGEVCDDGNNLSGDGCSADCLSKEKCGNGYIDLVLGEECEQTLPIPPTLTGVICDRNCKFSSALFQTSGGELDGNDFPLVSQQKQCRIALKLAVSAWDTAGTDSQPVNSLRGKIVSNRGKLNCSLVDGGFCVSDFIDCKDTVVLALLPDDENAIDMTTLSEDMDWGIDGCTTQTRANENDNTSSESDVHPSWCSVSLSENESEKIINVIYKSTPQTLPNKPLCTLNLVINNPQPTEHPDLEAGALELMALPGRVISSAGGIHCGVSEGICSSDPLPCDQPVSLSLVLEHSSSSAYQPDPLVILQKYDAIVWDQPDCYPNMRVTPVYVNGKIDGYIGGPTSSATPLWCTVKFPEASVGNNQLTVTLDYNLFPEPFRNMCSRFAQDYGFSTADCTDKIRQKVNAELQENATLTGGQSQNCDLELKTFFDALDNYYWSPSGPLTVEEIGTGLIRPLLTDGNASLSQIIKPPSTAGNVPSSDIFQEKLYTVSESPVQLLYNCLTQTN